MSLDSVRVLTLDLYGTLLDVESSLLDAFAEFLKARSYAGSPKEVVRSWETAYFQETMIDTLLDHGRTSFEQISRSCLRQVLSRLGIQHNSDDVEGLLAARVRGTLFSDVKEGLTALKSRYSLAVLSNGDLHALERTVDNLSLPVDRVISAEQAGAYKPHPSVYRTALDQLGLEAGQALHVASHAWDIRGAKAVGMNGAYVNRNGFPYDESPFQPDLEVADLVGLAAKLQ